MLFKREIICIYNDLKRWFRKIGINDNVPTFRVDFDPHPEKIQEILDNLCKQCSIKNQITTILLNIPNILIESVCVYKSFN